MGSALQSVGGLGRFNPGKWLTERGWWFLPLLLSAALALPWTFGDRWASDAAYYQAIATQMAREGTWFSPMQGEIPYFNKPPLAFWVHAAFVGAFGAADWAAHAPEAICFVLVCLLTGGLARRLHGSTAGLLAGCAMALTNEWIWRVGNFKLDSPHTLLLLAALMCWVRGLVPRRRDAASCNGQGRGRRAELGWCLAAGVAIGAALMTKPLYALVVVPLAILWLGLSGLMTRRRVLLVLLSGAVGVAVAAPWHVWMIVNHGQTFLRAYIHEQTVQRALGEFHDQQPWYWYVRLVLGLQDEAENAQRMWPIYGLAVVALAIIAARWRRGSTRAGDVLAALWTIGWFVGLSLFGGKRNYYLMVLHPGTAWLAGIALAWGLGLLNQRVATVLLRGGATLGVLACVVLFVRAPSEIEEARRSLASAEREQFMAFVRANRGEAIYDCGLSYRTAAICYIDAGVWPKAPSERTAFTPRDVPVGGLMCYRWDMLAKGAYGTYVDPADTLEFASTPQGKFKVYRRRGTK